MGLPVEKRRYTIEEYLRFEEKATERHEFHDGEILAMSGGTYRHAAICTDTVGALLNGLRGNECQPLNSNMRVRILRMMRYVYPDISVVCGQPEFDPDDPNQTTIVNPRLVIEVLSDSTELYDRGKKFELYRQVPTIMEYVLIAQKQPMVETFVRQADGEWPLNAWKGLDATATLKTLNLALPLSEIFRRVTFA